MPGFGVIRRLSCAQMDCRNVKKMRSFDEDLRPDSACLDESLELESLQNDIEVIRLQVCAIEKDQNEIREFILDSTTDKIYLPKDKVLPCSTFTAVKE